MTADWTDDNPSAHRALAQYDQGVPLARKPSSVGLANSTLVGFGSVTLVNAVIIDQPSYHMMLGLEYLSGLETVPFGVVEFEWQDAASGLPADPDWAYIPGGAAVFDFAHIQSPSRGDILTVVLKNLDPAQILTYNFGASQSSTPFPVFRLAETTKGAVTGFTRAKQNNQAGILGSVGVTVPISSHVDRLCSAYGGLAYLSVDNSAGTVPVLVQLLDPGIIAGGNPIYPADGNGAIAAITVTAGVAQTIGVMLPYGPVVIRETNASIVSTVTPTTTLMRSQ